MNSNTATGRVQNLNGDGTATVTMRGGTITACLNAATKAATAGQACTLLRVGSGTSASWQVMALAAGGAAGPNLAPNGAFTLLADDGTPAGWSSQSTGAASVLVDAATPGLSLAFAPDNPAGAATVTTTRPFYVDPVAYTVSVTVSATVAKSALTVAFITSDTLTGLTDGAATRQLPVVSADVPTTATTLKGTATPAATDQYALLSISLVAPTLTAMTGVVTGVSVRQTN